MFGSILQNILWTFLTLTTKHYSSLTSQYSHNFLLPTQRRLIIHSNAQQRCTAVIQKSAVSTVVPIKFNLTALRLILLTCTKWKLGQILFPLSDLFLSFSLFLLPPQHLHGLPCLFILIHISAQLSCKAITLNSAAVTHSLARRMTWRVAQMISWDCSPPTFN